MKLRSGFLAPLVLFVAASFVIACGGDDDEDPTPAASPTTVATASAEASATAIPTAATPPISTPATPSPTVAATATATATPQTISLDSLSLVYVDKRRGQGGDVFVADADGSNPRQVVQAPTYSRALALAGGVLAAAGRDGLLLIDLAGGDVETVEEGYTVFSGRFLDDATFLYSSRAGCAEKGGLHRVELPDYEAVELTATDLALTIVGTDLATNTVAGVPRGCDVGIGSIEVYDALTGEHRNTLDAEGCGWAIAALDQSKAITSWQGCTPPANHAGADATAYDFGIVGPTAHDVTVPVVDPNAMPWVRRPGHADVALGTTTSLGAGPGSARSGGIYSFSLAGRTFVQLVDGEGAEQYPVAWSPDGRYLLYATVEAQGLCHFAYVDVEAANPQPTSINADVTFCGVNGEVVGWTQLP